MLVKRSKKKTNYVLPVVILDKSLKLNWYYENEHQLIRAYKQLKTIRIGIKPLEPIIY